MAKKNESNSTMITKDNKRALILAVLVVFVRIVFGPEMVKLLSSRWANTITVLAILLGVLAYIASAKGMSISSFVAGFLPQQKSSSKKRRKAFELEDDEDEDDDDELTDDELEEIRAIAAERENQQRRRRATAKPVQQEEAVKVKPVAMQLPPKPRCPLGYRALYDPEAGTWVVEMDPNWVPAQPVVPVAPSVPAEPPAYIKGKTFKKDEAGADAPATT